MEIITLSLFFIFSLAIVLAGIFKDSFLLSLTGVIFMILLFIGVGVSGIQVTFAGVNQNTGEIVTKTVTVDKNVVWAYSFGAVTILSLYLLYIIAKFSGGRE